MSVGGPNTDSKSSVTVVELGAGEKKKSQLILCNFSLETSDFCNKRSSIPINPYLLFTSCMLYEAGFDSECETQQKVDVSLSPLQY